MNILALFSSPRGAESNSTFLLETILKEAEKNGHEVERLDIVPLDIQPCTGCRSCWTNEEKACIIDDDYHLIADAIWKADYIFMATPLYYWWVSASLKLALDRSYPPPFEKFAGKTMHMVITGSEPPDNQCFIGIRDGFTAMCRYLGTEFKYFYTVADPFEHPAQKNTDAIAEAKAIGSSL